ncbi:MAG: hydantoinase B/oxoprolinase family protein, partial [Candidatus Methanofastidiosia archaeon]
AGDSTDIFQEGLRIPPTKLLEKGRENSELLNLILSNTRTPKEREGDLKAQIASNKVGERRFYELCEKYSLKILKEAMCELMDYSERRIRRELSKIPDGVYSFRDFMESDGIEERKFKIEIEITAKGGDLSFDFSKTSPQAKGPINAVFPVTASCVYYVTRCVTDPGIPPNAGHYRPIEIIAPRGSLLNPIFPAPVAGGNVETSQRVADVLLGALSEAIPDRVIAACCGSMNNVSIGGVDPERGTYAYYETIGGGFGARPGKDGIDGVHTHMTNTQNTPIEALESNLPIRIRRYEIRRNSGGEGKFKGGCGIVRELMLLRGESKLSILAERHITKPYGLFGGGEGKRGKAYILSKGKKRKLRSKGTYDLKKDEVLVIETAGGGGYGLP